jgi:hypothetical protein
VYRFKSKAWYFELDRKIGGLFYLYC